MPDYSTVLSDLVTLSRYLGDPANDLAILGEGNTSARVDRETFLVKKSGKGLAEADTDSFVRVGFDRILGALEGPDLSDSDVRDVLMAARVDCSDETVRPSVETFLHAYLLSLPDVHFVAHSHPTAVNAILCSVGAEEAVSGRLFPDEIVCCGPAVCFVEYTDPGIVLARALCEAVEQFIDTHNMAPKVILMQNHGMIATGANVKDVKAATAMYVKTARVLLGTYALGGPHFLSPANVERIHSRPDESYRKKLISDQPS